MDKYVKEAIVSFSYLKDQTLELSAKIMRTFPTGCYVCRLNNHKYQNCSVLNKWKKAANPNFEQAKINKQVDSQAKQTMYSIPK